MSPYGNTDLGQHWLRYWLVAWRHQATNTWTNVDLSSYCPVTLIINFARNTSSLRTTYLKFHSNLSGDNELILRATDGVTLSVINLIYVCCLSSLFYCMQNHGRWSIFLWERAKCPFDNMIMMMSSNGNIFRVTGHLCGEFTGLQWIPRTKASDA